MAFSSGIGRLPDETLAMIVDSLDLQQLLTFSHVCKSFNTVARSHPSFWRDIRLAAVSDGALEFFTERINYRPSCKVSITLCLADHPSSQGIRSIVLPTVTRNLSRLTELELRLQSDVAETAFLALSNPAPFLETLALCFVDCNEGRPDVMVAAQLFGGNSPLLTSIYLSNVALPAQSIPAFQKAQFVIFHFSGRRGIPFYWLFDHLPELQTLIIVATSCIGVENGTTVATAPPPLRELQLWLPWPAYNSIFESVLNLASVKQIVCRRPRDLVAQQLVSHLRDTLELHFLCIIDRMVHMCLYDPETGRGRTLAVRAQDLPADLPRGVLFAPQLLERIVTLRLFARLAYLVPHVAEIPHCRTLEVILERHSSVPSLEISAPLRLPGLRAVFVTTSEHGVLIEVQAEQLGRFLSQLLGPGVRSKAPTLQLRGVSLAGDRDLLFNRFEEI